MQNRKLQTWLLVLLFVFVCGIFAYFVISGIYRSLPQDRSTLPTQGVGRTSWESITIIVTVVITAIFMAVFPILLVFSFLVHGRERLKGDVWASLERLKLKSLVRDSTRFEEVIKTGKASAAIDDTVLATNFKSRFDDHYGPLAFFVPLLCFTFVSFIGWMVIFFPNAVTGGKAKVIGGASYYGFAAMIQDGLVSYLQQILEAGSLFSFAFLGAYFWSIQGIIRRYLNSDLKPGNFMFATVRVTSSWIMAFILSVSLPPAWVLPDESWVMPVLGFFTGIFTMRIVQALWKALVQGTKVVPESDKNAFGKMHNLTNIPGINIFHADRLSEENIENIDDLTDANLLDLLTNLRYSTNTVVDWIDKALLIRYADEALYKQLAAHGIQSASDLVDVWLNAKDDTLLKRPELLTALSDEKLRLKGIVSSLYRSPNFEYIHNYWKKPAAHA